jgi:prepilin-type N-terminal cleavage/methylation domain-containing protein
MKNSTKTSRGYTLIELLVAIGLFALIMTLVSGAYLVMIGVTRQAQGLATGIDNLSFAIETMTRTIRTGTNYNCGNANGGDCSGGLNSFFVTDTNGNTVSYTLSNNAITQTIVSSKGVTTQNNVPLTDPVSVNVTNLVFYVTGTQPLSAQPQVTIIISGTVSGGQGKTETFSVETGATMRGTNL